MKILLICEHFASRSQDISGGVESQALLIAQGLAQQHSVTVLAGRRASEPTREQISNQLTIYRLKPTSGLKLTWLSLINRLVLSINQLIFSRKLKPDIVIGFNYTTHLPSWLIAKLHHCPAIAWYPDVLLGKWRQYFGITGLQGYLAEKTILALPWDQFIAISQKTKSLLIKQNIPSSKITVINPAINPVFFSKSKKTRKDQLLIISRLAKYKNIPEAIKIFSQVVQTQPQTKLIIVGTGPQTKAIKKLINLHQLEDKVIFKHHLSLKQLNSLMLQSKVILHPSLIEGFGLTPLEAAAAGCVPLVKSSTISKEVHPPAFYYHSIDQVVNRLNQLLSNPKYFHQQSVQVKKLALNFTVSKMINRFNKLLRQYA